MRPVGLFACSAGGLEPIGVVSVECAAIEPLSRSGVQQDSRNRVENVGLDRPVARFNRILPVPQSVMGRFSAMLEMDRFRAQSEVS